VAILKSEHLPLAARTIVLGWNSVAALTFAFIFPKSKAFQVSWSSVDVDDFEYNHCGNCSYHHSEVRSTAQGEVDFYVDIDDYIDDEVVEQAREDYCFDQFKASFLEEDRDLTEEEMNEALRLYRDDPEVNSDEFRRQHVDEDDYERAKEDWIDDQVDQEGCYPDGSSVILDDACKRYSLGDFASERECEDIPSIPYILTFISGTGIGSIHPFILKQEGEVALPDCELIDRLFEAWCPFIEGEEDLSALEAYINLLQTCDISQIRPGLFRGLANVYGSGKICFGTASPASLLDANQAFWNSKFNQDIADPDVFFPELQDSGVETWLGEATFYGKPECLPHELASIYHQLRYGRWALASDAKADLPIGFLDDTATSQDTSEAVAGWLVYADYDYSPKQEWKFSWVYTDEDLQTYYLRFGSRVNVVTARSEAGNTIWREVEDVV